MLYICYNTDSLLKHLLQKSDLMNFIIHDFFGGEKIEVFFEFLAFIYPRIISGFENDIRKRFFKYIFNFFYIKNLNHKDDFQELPDQNPADLKRRAAFILLLFIKLIGMEKMNEKSDRAIEFNKMYNASLEISHQYYQDGILFNLVTFSQFFI